MAPLSNISRKVFLGVLQRNCRPGYRLVSTSGKKEELDKTCEPEQSMYRKVPDFSKPLENKNWVSYGFSFTDEKEDNYLRHLSFLTTISVLCCGIAFIYKYFPDRNRYSWARREAFIRLHEREQLGLDPIDANYVDPAKIVLPPDEELSEEEIVI